MADITLKEQIAEVGREIGMRRATYPKFILRGILTEEDAAVRLARLEAVYSTLKKLKGDEDAKAAAVEVP